MISFKNVTKIYQMGSEKIRAIDNVSLEIGRGEFVALRGPSGSGKSSVMNILGCLDKPDSGEYMLDGKKVSEYDDNGLAMLRNQLIAFVHQGFNLLPRLTALENVEIPLVYSGTRGEERRKRARQALEAVGLVDRAGHLPSQLSGGQQQRVAIARALVQEAKLLLADEPTGNLDSKASVEILSILTRLHERGATIVLVTHEADIAEWAQYSVFFRDGQLGI